MEREIKFRAWSKNAGKMVDLLKITPLALSDTMNTQLAMQGIGGLFIPFSNEFELMQFTGLKDKNGVDIFESDIISHKYLGDERSLSIIEWHHSGWYANSQDDPKQRVTGYGDLYDCDDIEIIGNIYENHEILTPQKSN